MSSLIGQNIGGNPRGILNLGATINTPLDTTLRNVTDGLGNNSPLQLSTARAAVIAAVNYDSLFVGGLPAAGIKISQSSDPSVNGWILSVNGSFGDWFSLGFGNTNVSSTALISGSRITRDINIHTSMYVGIGNAVTTPSARLHVKGDGTNPIARFDNNAGTLAISVSNSGQLTWAGGDYFELSTSGRNLYSANILNFLGTWANAGNYVWAFSPINNVSATSGTHGFLNIGNTSFAAAAGSANFRPLNIAYTINNSGAQTGTATGIFLNATETALNGMGHNLMDLQRGGVSQFSVSRLGALTAEGITSNSNIITAATASYQWLSRSRMNSPSDGVITLFNNGSTDFNRLQFGGTTNAFPAVSRSGAQISITLADGSNFTPINASIFRVGGSSTQLQINQLLLGGFNTIQLSTQMYFDGDNRGSSFGGSVSMASSNVAAHSSAQLDVVSTTKGFLPPRQTEAQRLAISSPAVGLIVYQTDASDGLYVYKTGGWTLIA